MQGKNVSDIIERYLKHILADDDHIEISRSDMANLFDVVPSQINYVIKTRFRVQNGYLVDSKRGGGGYIKIERVNLLNNIDALDTLINIIGNSLSHRDCKSIVQTLYESKFLTRHESDIVLSAVSKQALSIGNTLLENKIRAKILISVLNHLRYEK